MSTSQTEKLKSLIQTAAILSVPEKTEWLALLGLMNDRQLAELEKILTSSSKPAPAAEKPKLQPSEKPRPISNIPQAGAPKLPQLSHIVNLPKNIVGQSFSAPAPVLAKAIPQNKEVKPQPKPISGFAAKLKSIFAEKELPPGRPNQPLEPVALKNDLQSEANALAVKTPAPAIKPPPVPAPKPKTPEPVLQPLPQAKISPPILPKPIIPPLSPSPSTTYNQQPAANPVQTPIQPIKPPLQKAPSRSAEPAFSQGINFSNISSKAALDNLSNIKQHLDLKDHLETKATTSPLPAGVDPVLGSLDDLLLLNKKALQSWDMPLAVKKIRQLIKNFGYFEVIFKIEKSLAYQLYLNTGSKLLSQQLDFEQLSGAEYLTREGFEKFTDLLSKIQTS